MKNSADAARPKRIRHRTPFAESDAGVVRTRRYPDRTETDVLCMLHDWNAGFFQGKPFEMFAVCRGDTVVGSVSLCQKSPHVASMGVEIFEEYRRSGFAYRAALLLFSRAEKLGYRVLLDQVRTDNTASIGLHEKLSFESDRYVFQNAKGHPVYLYIKTL